MTVNFDKMSSIEIMGLASDVASSYLSNNQVSIDDIPTVIQTVYHALTRLAQNPQEATNRPTPAIAIEDSITENYIVCLEDGKQLKMLKRHLKSAYNMSPEQYRERWNLSPDYPMVAPNYAKRRSTLAMKIGLGRKRKDQRQAA